MWQYSNESTQLNKLYKNKDKFGGTRDNFIFKLSIFYNKCQFISLSLDAYREGASIILRNQAQTHFYTNHESIILFDEFYQKIRLSFEDLVWEQLNFIK